MGAVGAELRSDGIAVGLDPVLAEGAREHDARARGSSLELWHGEVVCISMYQRSSVTATCRHVKEPFRLTYSNAFPSSAIPIIQQYWSL